MHGACIEYDVTKLYNVAKWVVVFCMCIDVRDWTIE